MVTCEDVINAEEIFSSKNSEEPFMIKYSPKITSSTGVAQTAIKYGGVPHVYTTPEAHAVGLAFIDAYSHLKGKDVTQFMFAVKRSQTTLLYL